MSISEMNIISNRSDMKERWEARQAPDFDPSGPTEELGGHYSVTVIHSDRWDLRRRVDQIPDGCYKSMIFHLCPTDDTVYYYNAHDTTACHKCYKDIPDNIQGAWLLHNMEMT